MARLGVRDHARARIGIRSLGQREHEVGLNAPPTDQSERWIRRHPPAMSHKGGKGGGEESAVKGWSYGIGSDWLI